MSLQHLAQELAAKGRHGDDTLVHMNRDEVAGLQQLAEAAGGSLTINPETGQPEAFFLAALLPALLGAAAPALGAAATGAGMAGLGTFLGSKMGAAALGGVAGGLMNRRQGGDFLTGAVTGGLGGMGGHGIGQGIANAGQQAASQGAMTALTGGAGDAASAVNAANTMGYGQQLSAGLQAGPGAVVDAMGGGKSAFRNAMMAATPAMAGMMPKGPDMGDYPHPILSTDLSQSSIPSSMGSAVQPYEPPMPSYNYQRGNVYVPTFRAAEGGIAALAEGGMEEGAFIVPADIVSMVGEGNTEAGYERIAQAIPGATPIRGKDGGQADTVETSIEGKQPARIAHGEMYVPPEALENLVDSKLPKEQRRAQGAKKLYAMMDKVRQQATGSKKQIKPVNMDRALA